MQWRASVVQAEPDINGDAEAEFEEEGVCTRRSSIQLGRAALTCHLQLAISIEEFFMMTGVKFMDQMTIPMPRRSTIRPSQLYQSTSESTPYHSLRIPFF